MLLSPLRSRTQVPIPQRVSEGFYTILESRLRGSNPSVSSLPRKRVAVDTSPA